MVRYGCIFIGVSPGITPGLSLLLTPFFAQKKKSAESTAAPLWLLILR